MDIKLLRRSIITKLLSEKEKEYYCHVQFVHKIALELAKKYPVDRDIIEIASLLHDIGRDLELEGEDHGDAGARIAADFLQNSGLPPKDLKVIIACIKKHNKDNKKLTLEEKIIISADCASKVIYHEAFMLMCKKQTYLEKLAWGKKYLEKGYHKIPLPEYKAKIEPRYKILSDIYNSVSA